MIYVLVGMIASGKSTWAREQAINGRTVIFSHDDMLMGLYGGHYEGFDRQHITVYKAIELATITSALAAGLDVVVDKTNLTPKTRSRYTALAGMYDTHATAVVFKNEGPKVHAERRFKSDPRGLTLEKWTRVAEEHDRQFMDIGAREGFFDEIYEPSTAEQWLKGAQP